ncbi:MAG: DegV family protein [Anaerolineae bacterium]|nr:DegV family protein [Anaerolineae bacterium]
MSVCIVTDSTVRFSLELGETRELPVTVVPLRIRLGEQEYRDSAELNINELGDFSARSGEIPQALPPTVEEFHRIYTELHQNCGEILSIHLPEKLGSTIQNARQAANMLLGQCKIEIIDAETTSLGLGILVEAAARAAMEGQTIDQIVRYVRGIIPQIYIVFFSEHLNDLRHADGIGEAQALLGTMLGIKPLFTLEGGEIIPIEKVKTRESAIEKLIEFVTEFDAINQVAIIKSTEDPTEETDYITGQLREVFPDLDVPVMAYGPVLASYVGAEALGVVVYEDISFEI